MIAISTDLLKTLIEEYDRCKGDYRKNTVVAYLGYSDSSNLAQLRHFYEKLADKSENRNLDEVEIFRLARILVSANPAEGTESYKVFDTLKKAYGESWMTAFNVLHEHHSHYNLFTFPVFKDILRRVDENQVDPAQFAKSLVAINILIKSELTKEDILKYRAAIETHQDPVKVAKALSKLAEYGLKSFNEENIMQILGSHDPMKTYEEIVAAELLHGYPYDPNETSVRAFFSGLYHMNYSNMFGASRRWAEPAVQEQLQQQQEEKKSYQWF